MTDTPSRSSARRRRRSTSRQGPPPVADAPTEQPAVAETTAAAEPAADASPQPDRESVKPGKPAPARRQRGENTRDASERALRDIVGSGRSQLGVSGALRGRDVNRPTDEDLADAERDVSIVRRHWKPPS